MWINVGYGIRCMESRINFNIWGTKEIKVKNFNFICFYDFDFHFDSNIHQNNGKQKSFLLLLNKLKFKDLKSRNKIILTNFKPIDYICKNYKKNLTIKFN